MPASASASLVGREEDLARIEAFLAASHGAGALALEGEPGIGKTTLWRAGIERARELGFRVLEARPAAAERELSFAALGDLLEGEHDEIGGLPAPQRRSLRIALMLEEAAGEPPEQRAIAAALLGLLRGLADDGPVLTAIDDVQWLDAPSSNALQFAFRRLDGEAVRMLVTRRPGSVEMSLDGTERVALGPLPLPALDQLVRERLGARFLRPTLRQLEKASGGNPFYALEIAAGLLRSARRIEPGEPLPVPASLSEVLLKRLATLTDAAREASLAAAALAQPSVTLVQKVSSGGHDGVLEALTTGVLDRDGDTLRFTHPLLASTLYGHCPPAERRDLHRRLARVVTDPEERARHLAEAAEGRDEELAAALEAAGAGAVARGAPDTAARLAKRAFELTPTDRQPEAHRRRIACARYTLASGDPQHAEVLLERHLRVAPPGRERAEVEFELGKARLSIHGASAARMCYERALALNELESADELELRAEILIELALLHAREFKTSSTASEQAVALAERIGKPDLLSRALGVHGGSLVLLGRPPPEEYWRRALAIERRTGELRYAGPTGAYSLAAWMRGDLETAQRTEEQVAASMRRRGDPMLPEVLLGICEAARVSGDWESAARAAQEAYELVVQTGRESLEPVCLLYQARVALPRGDLEAARASAEEARRLAAKLHESTHEKLDAEAMACSVLGQIAEASERYADAHDWITRAIEKSEQLGPLSEHSLAENIAADVKCLVMLGALEEASQQFERLVRMRDAMQAETLDGITDRTEGLLLAAHGDFATALSRLERAVETLETLRAPWPMQLAWTLLALGSVQRRSRQKHAAQETLERALEIFEQLGARLWAEKTRAELSRIGGRPSRPGSLTATEQRVADLVAAGHSNAEVAHRLFMSPKTVEWNLSKIYKKLHVRSRTELASKLAKRAAASR